MRRGRRDVKLEKICCVDFSAPRSVAFNIHSLSSRFISSHVTSQGRPGLSLVRIRQSSPLIGWHWHSPVQRDTSRSDLNMSLTFYINPTKEPIANVNKLKHSKIFNFRAKSWFIRLIKHSGLNLDIDYVSRYPQFYTLRRIFNRLWKIVKIIHSHGDT